MAANPYTWPTESMTMKYGADALCDAAKAENEHRIRMAKVRWDELKNELAALLKVNIANPSDAYGWVLLWLEDCDHTMLKILSQIEDGR